MIFLGGGGLSYLKKSNLIFDSCEKKMAGGERADIAPPER
jgi:hypothetical protein